jgi:hypothetical protein
MFPKMNLQSMALTSASKSAPVVSGGGSGTEYDIRTYDGQTVTEEGEVVSPDYPSDHPTGDNSWNITFEAPVGRLIEVTVTEFDTTNTWYQRGLTGYNAGSSAPIVNKIYGSAPNSTGTFSSTTLPIVFRSSGNEMTIVYDTWGSVTGTWKAEVAFV